MSASVLIMETRSSDQEGFYTGYTVFRATNGTSFEVWPEDGVTYVAGPGLVEKIVVPAGCSLRVSIHEVVVP